MKVENTKTREISSAIQIVTDCSKAWEDLRAGKFEKRTSWFSKSTSIICPNISHNTFEYAKERTFANLYGAYLLSKREKYHTGIRSLNLYMIHYTHKEIAALLDCLSEGSLYWEKGNIHNPLTGNRKAMHLFEELRPYIPQWYSRQIKIPLVMDRRDKEVQQVIQQLDDFLKEIIKNYNDAFPLTHESR